MSETAESSLLAATATEIVVNALRTSLSNEGRTELVYANKFYERHADQPLRISVADLLEALDRARSSAGSSKQKAEGGSQADVPPIHGSAPMLQLVRQAFVENPNAIWSYDELLAHFDKSGMRSTAKNPRDALRTAVANLVKAGVVKKVGPGVFRLMPADVTNRML
ncbi:MAG: hypothetical protein ACRBK7_02250 [Acidimicrobiales bacterium]